VKPNGGTPRDQFAAALITLLLAVAFYAFRVKGVTAHWCLLLLFPAIILHARRLHDLGHGAWLLLAPCVLTVSAFAVWLRIASLGTPLDTDVTVAAIAVSTGFALWGCIGSGQTKANRSGGHSRLRSPPFANLLSCGAVCTAPGRMAQVLGGRNQNRCRRGHVQCTNSGAAVLNRKL
jgi:uncharacterized membrane protein YhaH (DUF805 family)